MLGLAVHFNCIYQVALLRPILLVNNTNLSLNWYHFTSYWSNFGCLCLRHYTRDYENWCEKYAQFRRESADRRTDVRTAVLQSVLCCGVGTYRQRD